VAVGQAPVVERRNRAEHGSDVRIVREGRDNSGRPARVDELVVVDEADQRCAQSGQGAVLGVRHAEGSTSTACAQSGSGGGVSELCQASAISIVTSPARADAAIDSTVSCARARPIEGTTTAS
jgi:hypothetical protein